MTTAEIIFILIALVHAWKNLPEYFAQTGRSIRKAKVYAVVWAMVLSAIAQWTDSSWIVITAVMLSVFYLTGLIEEKKRGKVEENKKSKAEQRQNAVDEPVDFRDRQTRAMRETVRGHAKLIAKQAERIKSYTPTYEDGGYHDDLSALQGKTAATESADLPALEQLAVECADFIGRQSTIIKTLDREGRKLPPQPPVERRSLQSPRSFPSRRTRRSRKKHLPKPGDTVSFYYTNAKGEYAFRTVLIDEIDRTYLMGFDMDKADDRMFRLDRTDGEITDVYTGEVYYV